MLPLPTRLYDAVAAVFCTAIVAFYTPTILHIGIRDNCFFLVGGAALAFWGRRTRIWAGALGGALATSGAVSIDISEYYQQLRDAGNIRALIADDPVGDGREIMLWFFLGGMAGALIAALGRGLFDPSFARSEDSPAEEPEKTKPPMNADELG
jgi:hypothetical protein